MRQWLVVAVVLVAGCAELLPSTESGTPGGGPYCNRIPGDDKQACYPTEAERAAAWHAFQEPARAAAEREAHARRKAEEADRIERIKLNEEERKKDELAAAAERKAHADAWAARTAERERVKEAERAEIHRKAADPAIAGPAISALMCELEEALAALQRDLERERRVTAVAGVADLRSRREIATGMIENKDELAGWKESLVKLGVPRTPCKDVAGIQACRQNNMACAGANPDVIAVLERERDTLWTSSRQRPQ